MADFNKVMLLGNLTRDPEVRQLPSGTAVADIGLAINRKYRTQQGEDREETCFVTVSVFGRQAETCGQYLHKGSPVFVEGRLKYDSWEKNGQKQSRLTVQAERVQFLGAPRRSEFGDAPARGGERPPRTPPSSEPASEPPAEPAGGGDVDDVPF